MKAVRKRLRSSCSGRPPFSASMLQPKLVCSGVKRKSWFSTTSGVASRRSSTTTRTPKRSLSSWTWAMPSILLVAGQLGDALDHRRLVHLVGDLGDDDRGAPAAHLLDAGAGADDHRAAALVVGLARAGAAEDQRAGGEVGGGDELHQVGDGELGVLDQRQRRVDHLAEVVRRDVGRHADGDAAGAVDQHVREARRQDRGLEVLAVVVRLEVDGLLVDVGEEVSSPASPCAPRCSAWPPACRRPSSRSCPGRRGAAATWRSPAPCAPARRRSPRRRAGGTCP